MPLVLELWDGPAIEALYEAVDRGDLHAMRMAALIRMLLAQLRAVGTRCIGCHDVIRRAHALTFVTATDRETNHVRHALVCGRCADARSEHALHRLAAQSLGDCLATEAAASRPGATVHAAGHA